MGVLQIAWTTARKARLEPLYYVIILFFGAVAYLARYFVRFVFEERGRVLLETGLATVVASGLLMAVLLTWLLVRKEMEKNSILSVLAKPISRFSYVIGKFLGLSYAIGAGMIFVFLLFYLSLARTVASDLVADVLSQPMAGSYWSSFFDILLSSLENFYHTRVVFGLYSLIPMFSMVGIILSLCISLSLFWRILPTSVIVLLFLVLGSLSGHIHRDLIADGGIYAVFGWMVSLLLPDFQIMNIASQVAGGLEVSWTYLGSVVGSGLMFSMALLFLGAAFFEKKEIL